MDRGEYTAKACTSTCEPMLYVLIAVTKKAVELLVWLFSFYLLSKVISAASTAVANVDARITMMTMILAVVMLTVRRMSESSLPSKMIRACICNILLKYAA